MLFLLQIGITCLLAYARVGAHRQWILGSHIVFHSARPECDEPRVARTLQVFLRYGVVPKAVQVRSSKIAQYLQPFACSTGHELMEPYYCLLYTSPSPRD